MTYNADIKWKIKCTSFMKAYFFKPWVIYIPSANNQWRSQTLNGFWAWNSNLVKIYFAVIFILTVKMSAKLAHAMIAELSWHAQKCNLILLFFHISSKSVGVLSLPASIYLSACLYFLSISINKLVHMTTQEVFFKFVETLLECSLGKSFRQGYRSSFNMYIIDQKCDFDIFAFLA